MSEKSSEKEKQVEINERSTMPLALVGTLIAFAAVIIFAYSALGQRADAAAEKAQSALTATEDLDKRLRRMELLQEGMAQNIGFIRQMMEEDRRAKVR